MLLGAEVYGKGVDIWSLGCILAEIYSGKPIFCGNSTYSQLEKIIEVCGCRLISSHPTIKSQTSLAILESFPRHNKKSFRQILPDADEIVIDLLQKMLEFDPTKRITIDQVINHAYLNRFREKVTIRRMQKSNMEINCEKHTKEECWNLLKQK
jgi:mitogen-activated protein kinase 15